MSDQKEVTTWADALKSVRQLNETISKVEAQLKGEAQPFDLFSNIFKTKK